LASNSPWSVAHAFAKSQPRPCGSALGATTATACAREMAHRRWMRRRWVPLADEHDRDSPPARNVGADAVCHTRYGGLARARAAGPSVARVASCNDAKLPMQCWRRWWSGSACGDRLKGQNRRPRRRGWPQTRSVPPSKSLATASDLQAYLHPLQGIASGWHTPAGRGPVTLPYQETSPLALSCCNLHLRFACECHPSSLLLRLPPRNRRDPGPAPQFGPAKYNDQVSVPQRWYICKTAPIPA
jgi:hypothetical protein